jgi:Trypsin-like peptidase domain
MIVANVIQRVFWIRYASATGTMFSIDVDGRQYLVTAQHVIEGAAGTFEIEMFHDGEWKFFIVELVGHSPTGDVSVMTARLQVNARALAVEPSSAGLAYGQDVYFLGFPLGLHGETQINNGFPFPFIKRATVSMLDTTNSPVLMLDGINNPGFSGGPVAFMPYGSHTWRIAGVISGYRYQDQPVYAGSTATELSHQVNTGLIEAEPILRATELINGRPIGFVLPD